MSKTLTACWFGSNGAAGVSFCDAGTGFSEDYISSIPSESIINFQYESLKHSTKQYNIELKPLFSAFMWRNLALTSLRSFLLFYLPLLEPRANMEDEDDEDFLQDTEEDRRVDLVTPFKKSVKQIGREVNLQNCSPTPHFSMLCSCHLTNCLSFSSISFVESVKQYISSDISFVQYSLWFALVFLFPCSGPRTCCSMYLQNIMANKVAHLDWSRR